MDSIQGSGSKRQRTNDTTTSRRACTRRPRAGLNAPNKSMPAHGSNVEVWFEGDKEKEGGWSLGRVKAVNMAVESFVVKFNWDNSWKCQYTFQVNDPCWRLPPTDPAAGTTQSQKRLVKHLSQDTYCRLAPTEKDIINYQLCGVSVKAVRDIPKGTNPFVSNRKTYELIRLSKADVDSLPPAVQEVLRDHVIPDVDGAIYAPASGLNDLNIEFFINHCDRLKNLEVKNLEEEEHKTNTTNTVYTSYVTTRHITEGEYLYCAQPPQSSMRQQSVTQLRHDLCKHLGSQKIPHLHCLEKKELELYCHLASNLSPAAAQFMFASHEEREDHSHSCEEEQLRTILREVYGAGAIACALQDGFTRPISCSACADLLRHLEEQQMLEVISSMSLHEQEGILGYLQDKQSQILLKREQKAAFMDKLMNTVCRLKRSPLGGVGIFAISDISAGSDPFDSRRHLQSQWLQEEDLHGMPHRVKQMIQDYFDQDTFGRYPVLEAGLNAVNISFFCNEATGSANANLQALQEVEHYNMHSTCYSKLCTTMLIPKGQELLCQYQGEYERSAHRNLAALPPGQTAMTVRQPRPDAA